MVTSFSRERGGRRGETEVHTSSAYETKKQVTEARGASEGQTVWESRGERETVVMIDARLPPLCSTEWLQQKSTE